MEADWQARRQIGKQAGRRADRQAGRHAGTQAASLACGQAGRDAGGEAARKRRQDDDTAGRGPLDLKRGTKRKCRAGRLAGRLDEMPHLLPDAFPTKAVAPRGHLRNVDLDMAAAVQQRAAAGWPTTCVPRRHRYRRPRAPRYTNLSGRRLRWGDVDGALTSCGRRASGGAPQAPAGASGARPVQLAPRGA